jgi:hypothetical protein
LRGGASKAEFPASSLPLQIRQQQSIASQRRRSWGPAALPLQEQSRLLSGGRGQIWRKAARPPGDGDELPDGFDDELFFLLSTSVLVVLSSSSPILIHPYTAFSPLSRIHLGFIWNLVKVASGGGIASPVRWVCLFTPFSYLSHSHPLSYLRSSLMFLSDPQSTLVHQVHQVLLFACHSPPLTYNCIIFLIRFDVLNLHKYAGLEGA